MAKKKVKSKKTTKPVEPEPVVEAEPVVESEPVVKSEPVVEKPKKKLNGYFQAMLEAKKGGAESFEYKGNTYLKNHTKNGMVVYKKQV